MSCNDIQTDEYVDTYVMRAYKEDPQDYYFHCHRYLDPETLRVVERMHHHDAYYDDEHNPQQHLRPAGELGSARRA